MQPLPDSAHAMRPITLRRPWHLVALAGLVLAMHWAVLGGFTHWAPGLGEPAAPDLAALSTRLLTAPSPTPAAAPTPAPVQAARASPRPQGNSAPRHTDLGLATEPAAETPTATTGVDTASDAMAPSNSSTEPAAGAAETPAEAVQEIRVPSTPPVAAPARADRPLQFAFPPSIQLNYDVIGQTDGQTNVVSATIVWRHDGGNYQANLNITKFMVSLRQWNSKGALTAAGLAPVRFGEKGFRRAEVASHFVRDEGRVIFSSNSAPAPLLPGAQDHMSVFIQLASLWAGEPQRFSAGDTLSFQSIGPRQAETWTFVVSEEARIQVPGGTMQAVKLTREATSEYSTKAEIWLAPQLAYLPAQIRLSEPNGNVLDMVWTGSQAL